MESSNEKQNIPQGWRKNSLESLTVKLKTGGTPTSTNKSFYDGDIPFVKIDDMTTSGKYLSSTLNFISDEGLKNSSAWLIPKGSILYSIYATVGEVSINLIDVATNQAIMGIVLNEKEVDRDYIYQYLLSIKHSLRKYFKETTQKNLTSQIVKEIDVLLPKSKEEQQKIAKILELMDEDIAKTQKVIKATEKLKKGLMQQLFTRGIGHTKFKKTKLGEIPEEWKITTIKDSSIELIDGDRGANYPKQSDFTPEGYCLFLSAKNVSKNGFVFNELSFISQKKDQELRKGKLERGDIILTSRGTVGNIAYYDNIIPFENIRINSGMLIIRHGKQFNPVFLYKYFSSPQMKKKYLSMGSGSAQPQLPIGSFEQTEIPILSILEQQKIAEIISTVDEKISINKKLKNKFTLLKKGLMQDLLSGKVRV